MARVLEGGRESLKLRDIRAAVWLPGMLSSSTPSTHLLSPMHTALFLQWEGKTGVTGPFWKESGCNYFSAASGAAAELPLSSKATKPAK